MARREGILIEIRDTRQEPGAPAGRLDCSPSLHPKPGQYLLAASPDPAELLATPLFAASLPGQTLLLAPPIPSSWNPGVNLQLRGPLGNGFSLPTGCRRLALAALDCSPSLLFALASQALNQGAAVTFHASQAPSGLPDDVEILPFDLLPGTLAWADGLCAAFPLPSLAAFRRLAGLTVHQRFGLFAQALVLTPLPCAGVGSCGACAVPTPRGWKLACSDGPVFDLNQLELP